MKTAAFALTALVLGVVLSAIYFDLFDLQDEPRPIYELVDRDAPILLSLPINSGSLNVSKSATYWGLAQDWGFFKQLSFELKEIDSLLANEPVSGNSLLKQWLVVAEMRDAESISFLHLVEFQSSDVVDGPRFQFEKKPASRKFRNSSIHSIGSAASSWNVAALDCYVLVSNAAFQLDNSIAVFDELRSVYTDSSFVQLAKARGSSGYIEAYINYQSLSNMHSLILKPEHKDWLSKVNQIGFRSRFNLLPEQEGFHLSGLTVPPKTPIGKLYSVSEYAVARDDMLTILPSNTALFRSSVSPPPAADLSEQHAWFTLSCFEKTCQKKSGLLLMSDEIDASIQELLSRDAIQQSEDKYKDFTRFEIIDEALLNSIYSEDQRFALNSASAVQIENALLIANSWQLIKDVIDEHKLNRVLSQNASLNGDDWAELAAYELYVKPSGIFDYFHSLFSEGAKSIAVSGDISSLHFQHKPGFPFLFSQVALSSKVVGAETQAENRLWRARLDTMAYGAPHIVRNHSTGDAEILIQDASKQLYLISKSGDIRWKKQLSGFIVGTVEQIDFYRNRKLQYLFATEKQVHIIDRLGRYVEDYPFNLSAEASGGLTLVDYKDQGKYRIFIGSKNGNFYGYEKSGKSLPGWNPKKGVGNVEWPLLYFQHKGKDYLTVTSADGKVLAYNRRGDQRFDPVQLSRGVKQQLQLSKTENGFFLQFDDGGTLKQITNKGQVLDKATHKHQNLRVYVHFDLAKSGEQSSMYYYSDTLDFVSWDGSLTKRHILPADALPAPYMRYAKDKIKYATFYSSSTNQIFVFDGTGVQPEGFPVYGSSAPVIGSIRSDNSTDLVCGDAEGGVYLYRLK